VSQNERAYYRQRDILLGLRKRIIEHPSYKEKVEYVRVVKSQKGNHYLTMWSPKTLEAVSVAWFSGSKDPKSFRGFRAFYPFGRRSPPQIKRDFRIHFQPTKSPELVLGKAVSKVAEYLLSEEAFKEGEDRKVFYTAKLYEE
jgi:hypothetical protein